MTSPGRPQGVWSLDTELGGTYLQIDTNKIIIIDWAKILDSRTSVNLNMNAALK